MTGNEQPSRQETSNNPWAGLDDAWKSVTPGGLITPDNIVRPTAPIEPAERPSPVEPEPEPEPDSRDTSATQPPAASEVTPVITPVFSQPESAGASTETAQPSVPSETAGETSETETGETLPAVDLREPILTPEVIEAVNHYLLLGSPLGGTSPDNIDDSINLDGIEESADQPPESGELPGATIVNDVEGIGAHHDGERVIANLDEVLSHGREEIAAETDDSEPEPVRAKRGKVKEFLRKTAVPVLLVAALVAGGTALSPKKTDELFASSDPGITQVVGEVDQLSEWQYNAARDLSKSPDKIYGVDGTEVRTPIRVEGVDIKDASSQQIYDDINNGWLGGDIEGHGNAVDSLAQTKLAIDLAGRGLGVTGMTQADVDMVNALSTEMESNPNTYRDTYENVNRFFSEGLDNGTLNIRAIDLDGSIVNATGLQDGKIVNVETQVNGIEGMRHVIGIYSVDATTGAESFMFGYGEWCGNLMDQYGRIITVLETVPDNPGIDLDRKDQSKAPENFLDDQLRTDPDQNVTPGEESDGQGAGGEGSGSGNYGNAGGGDNTVEQDTTQIIGEDDKNQENAINNGGDNQQADGATGAAPGGGGSNNSGATDHEQNVGGGLTDTPATTQPPSGTDNTGDL
jgi:hypothetical protein